MNHSCWTCPIKRGGCQHHKYHSGFAGCQELRFVFSSVLFIMFSIESIQPSFHYRLVKKSVCRYSKVEIPLHELESLLLARENQRQARLVYAKGYAAEGEDRGWRRDCVFCILQLFRNKVLPQAASGTLQKRDA